MSDIEIVETVYRALGERDVATLFDLLHKDCVITEDERLPWGGRYIGHDGFAAFGAALTGSIDSKVTTDAMFEADGSVYQMGRTRGTALTSNKTFDIPEVHTWTIRDGKVASAHFAIDTGAMLDALRAG